VALLAATAAVVAAAVLRKERRERPICGVSVVAAVGSWSLAGVGVWWFLEAATALSPLLTNR
jgi:hypothetical protein